MLTHWFRFGVLAKFLRSVTKLSHRHGSGWINSFVSLLLSLSCCCRFSETILIISLNAVFQASNIFTIVMYTDNHRHDIVVKRNTSSSKKRSRDGVRSHVTPAKKRSSFTSTTCLADKEQIYTQDMAENEGAELVRWHFFFQWNRFQAL